MWVESIDRHLKTLNFRRLKFFFFNDLGKKRFCASIQLFSCVLTESCVHRRQKFDSGGTHEWFFLNTGCIMYTSIIEDNCWYLFYIYFSLILGRQGRGPIIFRATSFLIPLLCLWNWAWTAKICETLVYNARDWGEGGDDKTSSLKNLPNTFCTISAKH
jgi:hypothetical protein